MINIDNRRILYIDIFRCIGILLMISGHVGFFGERYSRLIHAFNMPMFFIITGFFIENSLNKKLFEFINRLCKRLIVPYFIVGFFHYILWIIIRRMGIQFGGDVKSTIDPLISLLWDNTKGLPIAGALWFLTALFFSELIYYVINKVPSKVVRILLISIISLSGCYWRKFGLPILPYAINAAMVGTGFIAIGNVYSKCMIKIKWYYSMALLIGLSILSLANDSVGMNTGKYGIVPIFWICAVGISITILNITKDIAPFMEQYLAKMYNITTSIGRNSIIYVCFNQICIGVTMRVLESLSYDRLFVTVLTFILTLIELQCVNKVIMSTKIKKIFGK